MNIKSNKKIKNNLKNKSKFLDKSNQYLINNNHIVKDKRSKNYKLTSFIVPESNSRLNKIKINVNHNNSKEKFFKICKISPKKTDCNWNNMCNKYLKDIIQYNKPNKRVISKNINKNNLSIIKSGSFKNFNYKDNIERNNESFYISNKLLDKNKNTIVYSKNNNKLNNRNKSTNIKTIKVNTSINNENEIQINRNENIQINKKIKKTINFIKNKTKFTIEDSTNTSEINKNNIKNIIKYKNNIKDYNKIIIEKNLEDKANNIYNDIINESTKFSLVNKKIIKDINSKGFVKSRESFYEFGEIIGKGNFGQVYLAKQILTNTNVAIKVISKLTIKKKENKNKVELEIKLLRLAFGNNYIVKLYEHFENENDIFLVFEYCSNGDILKYIKSKGVMNEIQSMRIIYQILLGLDYLHDNNIFHRDIKLDNIILGNKMRCKIGDFGISLYKNKNDIIKDTAGTPAYLAPEVLKSKGKANFKSDIWSLGVFLYAIVFGTMPFKSKKVQEVYQLILRGKFKFPENIIVSENLYDIIKKMLIYNIDDRPSVKQILKHKWFKQEYINDLNIENKILHNLKSLNSDIVSITKYLVNKFGFTYEYLETSLNNKKMNHCTSCFFTLYNKLS